MTRIPVFLGMLVLAACLSSVTVFTYGKWYSHDRYWHGTIARVAENQALLVRDLLLAGDASQLQALTPEQLARMFSSLDNKMIVEVFADNELVYSNDNRRFARGSVLQTVGDQPHVVVLSAYLPPTWKDLFLRWLKSPGRWFEPSFDPVTMPFLWFFAIYTLGLLCVGLLVKSTYLERDVLGALQALEKRAQE